MMRGGIIVVLETHRFRYRQSMVQPQRSICLRINSTMVSNPVSKPEE
jgi:hypothetical protein